MHAFFRGLLVATLLVGCGSQNAASRAPLVPDAPDAPEPASVDPVRDRAALAQARSFTERVAQGKAEISSEALVRRAFPEGISKLDARRLTPAMRKVLASLLTSLKTATESGGVLTLVRVQSHGAEQRVLTRFVGDGLDYYDWVLVDGPGGQKQVADVHVYSNGEFMSGLLRRVFMPVLALNPSFDASGLSQADRQFIQQLPKFNGINTLIESDPKRALEIVGRLPTPLSEAKFVVLIKLRAASSWAGDLETSAEATAAYYQICEDFVARFPDDPAVDLIGLDAWVENKEWSKTLRALDRLEKRVGEDGYLSLLRAVVHSGKGELSQAATHAYKARRLDREDVDLRWFLFDILAKSRRFGAAVDELRSLRDELDVEAVYFDDELYETAPEWGPLYESSEYRAFHAEGQAALEDE